MRNNPWRLPSSFKRWWSHWRQFNIDKYQTFCLSIWLWFSDFTRDLCQNPEKTKTDCQLLKELTMHLVNIGGTKTKQTNVNGNRVFVISWAWNQTKAMPIKQNFNHWPLDHHAQGWIKDCVQEWVHHLQGMRRVGGGALLSKHQILRLFWKHIW